MLYRNLRHLFPVAPAPPEPQRIVLLRPCCIGDAVMATAALSALREAFPRAHISWALGPWSARAIEAHPDLDDILPLAVDMPLRSPLEMAGFIRQLRRGRYDLAISLVRSPLMSLAVYLSGIPYRAGLDSAGRGFGYNLPVPIDPAAREHESEIYLKVIRAVAGRQLHAHANLPVTAPALDAVRARLAAAAVDRPFIVAHAGGGSNPGANMADKRYPPAAFAALLSRLTEALGAGLILLGGPDDAAIVDALARRLPADAQNWTGALSFQEIGALALEARVYIGNDTGLTHLAAASGAKTVMIMGPTDPLRYAPFTPDSLALWKPQELRTGGAAAGQNQNWNWARDGISVDEAAAQILDFLDA